MQQQQSRWQTLTGHTQIERDYRELGRRIAAVLALERGESGASKEEDHPDGWEALTAAEQSIHLRACVRLVAEALDHSLQAVANCTPQLGDTVILTQVECISVLDRDDASRYHRLN